MDKIFETFTFKILKLNKLVNKIKQYEMLGFDLKAIHVMCVYYLDAYPEGLTSSELVKLTLEDKAAISRALKTLQDRGYMTYCSGKHNAAVQLTDAGREFAAVIKEKSDSAVAAGSAQLTDEERELFYGALDSIAENLKNYYEDLIKKSK